MEHRILRLSPEKETKTAISTVINQSLDHFSTQSSEIYSIVDEKTAYASQKDEFRLLEPTHHSTTTTGYESVNKRLAELTALIGSSHQTEQSDSRGTIKFEPSTSRDGEKQLENIDPTQSINNSDPAKFSLIKHTRQNRGNSTDTRTSHQLDDGTNKNHTTIYQGYEPELTRLAELQAAARRSIEELEEEHQKRHSNQDRKLETKNQQSSRERESSNSKIQPGYQPPLPTKSRGFER